MVRVRAKANASEESPATALAALASPVARWGGWRNLAATAVDEALLSGISLAQAIVLVHAASKDEYGRFALVTALLLLMRGVQNALVLTLLSTQGARRSGAERASFVRTLARLQGRLGMLLAVVLGLGVAATTGAPALAVGSALSLAGGWLREYRRGVALLEGDNRGALAGDALFAGLAGAGLAGLTVLDAPLAAGGVLATTGIAAGAAAWIGFPRLPVGAAGEHAPVVAEALRQGRWTLPGMAVMWGQNSGYLYIVGLALDAAAVADIAAARLFVVPLLLASVAWGRVFLPRAATLLGEGRDQAVIAGCVRSTAWIGGLALAYAAALAAAFALGLGAVLPAAYAGVASLVIGWCVFAGVTLLRSIASTALIARLHFRALFAVSATGAAASLALVLALLGPLGARGAISGLIGGELILGALAWRLLVGRRRAP
jgi:O-antigen/teichoic acid export membrane protein